MPSGSLREDLHDTFRRPPPANRDDRGCDLLPRCILAAIRRQADDLKVRVNPQARVVASTGCDPEERLLVQAEQEFPLR